MAISDRCLMTWEPKKSRWRKMHKGHIYTVACSTLGRPDNKEASYQAANAWWKVKLVEIESEPRWPNHEIVEDLIADRAKALEAGAWPEAEELHGRLVRVANPNVPTDQAEAITLADDPDLSLHRIELARKAGLVIPDDVDPKVLEYIFGPTRVALDRHQRRPRSYTNTGDRTVTAQVVKYLDLEKARVEGNHVSVGEYEIVAQSLHNFETWIDRESSIDAINADKVEGWWTHLMSLKGSTETKKKKLRHVKTWINWMAEKGLIPRPSNLDSKKHRFGGGLKEITTIEPKELRSLIDVASGQLKLHLLLMANCGMTQIDITDLHPSEVDWQAGRIKRRRSKTSVHKNVPIVDYPLWTQTFDLLKKYGHRTGDHALLTASGLLWVRDVLKPDGKRSKVDNIKSNFAHIKKRKKLTFSMKVIRKTSASLLETQPEFARYATMFLGHSPRTIADRHYVAPDKASFDRAVAWLGKELGMVYCDS